MCRFMPVGRIVLLFVLIATRPGDRLIAQSRASQPAVNGSTTTSISKTPDPCASAGPRTAPTSADKRLAIKLNFGSEKEGRDALSFEDVFWVSLTNTTDRPIKLWDLDSKRGWCQLSFELTVLDSGQKYVIRRTPLNDANPQGTRRKRIWWTETLQIRPHHTEDYDVLLGDGQESEQGWTGLPQNANGLRFSIVARFESAANRSESDYWTGATRSGSVEARIVKGQRSPHYYLSCGFVEKAFRILKADPSWVSKRDDKYGTLLNTAISATAKDVVKWLLEHGADVNAADKDQRTPLELAAARPAISHDPEIVELILQKKPELIRGKDGRIILQAMLHDAASGWGVRGVRSDTERRECRALVDLYVKAGAEYDLFAAIHMNDVDRAKTLMKQSPRPAVGSHWKNPLRLAASVGSVEICRLLIEQYRFDVDDFAGGGGYPVMANAVAHPEVVQLLIEHGANFKRRYQEQEGWDAHLWPIHCDNPTALHYAAEYGAPGTIQLLIDKGLDVFAIAKSNVEDNSLPADPTALDLAASSSWAANVAAIVQHPKFQAGDLATRSRLLNRCLLKVAEPDLDRPTYFQTAVLQSLLKAGADPKFSDNGATALQKAARSLQMFIDPSGDEDVLEFNASIMREINVLRQHGARLDVFTAASIGDEVEVARLLKQNRALANSKSFDGCPALLVAAAHDYRSIVKQLLDAGCDVDIRTEEGPVFEKGETALIVAADYQRNCIAKLLLDRGANVNAASSNPEHTPLAAARENHDVQLEKMLLDKG
ncbi:MAG TPA: ankyrin repeat domain-containing protein, partial [Planctomycetaceae bacterium]|nr:ankyrin repeat domain-containing protein [Planctomycetaceae bacterium]